MCLICSLNIAAESLRPPPHPPPPKKKVTVLHWPFFTVKQLNPSLNKSSLIYINTELSWQQIIWAVNGIISISGNLFSFMTQLSVPVLEKSNNPHTDQKPTHTQLSKTSCAITVHSEKYFPLIISIGDVVNLSNPIPLVRIAMYGEDFLNFFNMPFIASISTYWSLNILLTNTGKKQ